MYVQMQKQSFCHHSTLVNHLKTIGVKNLTQKATPIAGRLAYFAENWHVICKDPWVIKAITGYTIDLINQPYQPHPPHELQFAAEGQEALREEIESMITSGAPIPIFADTTDTDTFHLINF